MPITFRKRPDHTLSAPPEAQEPHLDLHSLDARQQADADDDDIPLLLPEASNRLHRDPIMPETATRPATPLAGYTTPDPIAGSPVRRRENTQAVHIPPPASVTHRPLPTHATTDLGSRPIAAPGLPGHAGPDDYSPFLNAARGTREHHSKPELYVWSDDENDAFAQVAQADFTLNRIQPMAGRPTFDASLFRAPSRPDALAGAVEPTAAQRDDQAIAMQAEIDTLVTELLDESHAYLKRRFLEEIPEIIAKYRQGQ